MEALLTALRNILCWVSTLQALGHQRGRNLIGTSNSTLTDVGDILLQE